MQARDFRPHRLLRNPHVQSLLASSGLRRFLYRRRRLVLEQGCAEHLLDCGAGVRLQGFHSPQQALPESRGLIVLLHGWEGSALSTYLLHTGARLLTAGYDVFRLNFRDHGGTQQLNEGIFHSCRLDETVAALKVIAERFACRPLGLVGFSLGGNFALRMALQAPGQGIPLASTVAVCPVISAPAGLAAIEKAPWFYEAYFMRKWRGSLRQKQNAHPKQRFFADHELQAGLRDLTRTMVERHTDFGTLENYLDAYSIAGDRLAHMTVPATIVTAEDDPIIPVADFRNLRLSPSTELEIAPFGGHCGFIRDLSLRSWIEEFIVARLQRHFSPPEPVARADQA